MLRTALQLSSGKFALVNIAFLVAENGLTDEDLLIGLAVLEHLKVDRRTMLERNCRDLDGMDCS